MKKFVFAVYLSMLCYISFSKDIVLNNPTGICTQTISLNGNSWRIATDSSNIGRQKEWFKTPPLSGSKQTLVPWVIQDIFHNYHGVAWYWHEFETPKNLHSGGRYLLKFSAVDYLAEVWLNGNPVGIHEGSETPFDFDITSLINPDKKNRLVVRVLNPTYKPIDGIALKDTPSGAKQYPFSGNAAYNSGGIIGNVELQLVPSVRICDLNVVPDWKTGKVKIQATILNMQPNTTSSMLTFNISEARTGLAVALENYVQKIEPGTSSVIAEIQVAGYKLWSPDEPMLYRITAAVQTQASVDEQSVRIGFRDFHFENGFFRLNGKRIFLNGANFSTHYPVGFTVPLNENMLRQDIINLKSLGFNFVRIPFGCPNPRVLDIYDELGILVQQEHFGCWQMGDYGDYKYPKPDNINDLLIKRFENSIRGVILRDRNHASLVMWGVLNENGDGIIFRKAVDLLPALRDLDPTRVFVLNSGRFDRVKEIGSMSNPGSSTWDVAESELKDWHPYVWIPYSPKTLDELSGRSGSSGQKIYISETGLCFPVDLPSELGDFQQCGKEQADDAVYFKRQYDKFLNDWEKFDLSKCWARTEDYFKDGYTAAGSLREKAETAIRSNPYVVSYTPTNGVADYVAGESVATSFRRLKPELMGSVLLGNSSLRWCIMTEPQSIYGGDKIKLRLSLSNLDVLKPGKYPATVKVVDPDMKNIFVRSVVVNILEPKDGHEPPFAQTIVEEDITINGPAGKYQFLATLNHGGTAIGGKTEFYVTDKSKLPQMPKEIVLCGKDSIVSMWLKQHNVKTHLFNQNNRSTREVILIAGKAQDSTTMVSIARQMECGSVVIFLSPSTFGSGNNSTRWLPLIHKGVVESMDHVAAYYRADRWTKNHPIFGGMPSGGMIDYQFFRNIVSQYAISQEYVVAAKSGYSYDESSIALDYPKEAVCGAIRLSHNYCSGIHVGVWDFGVGRFIVNTLSIEDNLGKDPAADRLFCNMLNFTFKDLNKPMTRLPMNFNQKLVEIGYVK